MISIFWYPARSLRIIVNYSHCIYPCSYSRIYVYAYAYGSGYARAYPYAFLVFAFLHTLVFMFVIMLIQMPTIMLIFMLTFVVTLKLMLIRILILILILILKLILILVLILMPHWVNTVNTSLYLTYVCKNLHKQACASTTALSTNRPDCPVDVRSEDIRLRNEKERIISLFRFGTVLKSMLYFDELLYFRSYFWWF